MAKAVKKSEMIADLSQFLQQYYSELLENAGFVPFGNNPMDWYKIENDLLYGVHFPIHGTVSPFIYLETGISIVPVFVWDEIPFHSPINDNFWGFGNDRFLQLQTEHRKYLDLIERTIGPLKRASYTTPALITGLPCGRNLLMLNSERRGAEVVEDIALPLANNIKNVEDIYRFNLEYRCAVSGCDTLDQYLKYVTKDHPMWEHFSSAFADECIAVRDEKMYPYVIDSLEMLYARCMEGLASDAPWAKRNHKYYVLESERANVLMRVMREKDYVLWEESIAIEREKMVQQIQKKLPQLQIVT